MPATYEPIATQTLGSAAATIDFTSIPATYTDLRVVISGIQSADYLAPTMILNSDSGTNYSNTKLKGNGSTASSSRNTNSNRLGSADEFTGSASIPNFVTFDIFSYAGSTNKTCLWSYSLDANGSGSVTRGVGLWRNTAAITAITINNSGWGTDFATGSTATLYGIKNA